MNANLPSRRYVDPSSAVLRHERDNDTLVLGLHLRSGMDENNRDVAILFNHDRDAVLRAAQKCLPGT